MTIFLSVYYHFRAFFLRLKTKTALQFSFLLGVLVIPFGFSLEFFLASWFSFFLPMYFFSHFLNQKLRKKLTGIPCPICGAKYSHLLFPARRSSKHPERGGFACTSFDHGSYPDVLFCPFCRNGFLTDVTPEKFSVTCSEGLKAYEDVVDEKYLAHMESRRLTYEKFLETHGHFLKNKNVLEIGCYYGAFTQMLPGFVENYVGVEPSKHAAQYTQAQFQQWKIHNTDIDTFIKSEAVAKRSFDVVVMFDVIEHLPNPLSALKSLREMLKDDGLLIFSTINMEASISLALGARWPWIMDMHYYYFSDRGLVSLLQRSGFLRLQHCHFPYVVSAKYFVEKIAGLLGLPGLVLAKFTPKVDLTIRLGDTVLIISQVGQR